jgi:hypothetical protein
MAQFWLPKEAITPEEDLRGVRAFQADGVASQVREAFLAGPILVAYALMLGASHATLGVLAAIGPLSHVLQLPTIALVERLRRRKQIVCIAAASSRITWIMVILSPWLLPNSARLPVFLLGATIATALGTISAAAWSPWIRDFLGTARIGSTYASRLSKAIAITLPITLLAGIAIDQRQRWNLSALEVYSMALGIGALAGLLGLWAIARIPEPQMEDRPRRPWRDLARGAWREPKGRQVMVFLACWTFAVNLASPFYTVYLLERFGLPIAWVIALTAISQGMSALAVRSWGRIAEQFAMSTVLRISGVVFLLTLASWPFIGLLDSVAWQIGLLIVAHAVAGLAVAGVNLGTATLAMEVAPPREAPGFLALNAFLSGIAAGIAPMIGGFASTWLGTARFSITLNWSHDGTGGALNPMDLRGLDFLWMASLVAGLYAIHRLLALPEGVRGAANKAVAALASELQVRALSPLRTITTVPGIRDLVDFPYALVSLLTPERRRRPRKPPPQ